MTFAVVSPSWPVRVVTVESRSPATRWEPAAFRHHGIALHTNVEAVDALLGLSREPRTVLLVPTDMVGLPLAEFVKLATALGRAAVMIGRVVGEADELVGLCLELGARGVVDLPVTPERLAEAVSRMFPVTETLPEVLSCGPFSLDLGQHRAHFDGTELHLALREFELLELLMRTHPRVATASDLATRLGGESAVTSAHVAVAVRRLRLRLNPAVPSPHRVIETVRGVGYRIVA